MLGAQTKSGGLSAAHHLLPTSITPGPARAGPLQLAS